MFGLDFKQNTLKEANSSRVQAATHIGLVYADGPILY